jgi:hypothetical protein
MRVFFFTIRIPQTLKSTSTSPNEEKAIFIILIALLAQSIRRGKTEFEKRENIENLYSPGHIGSCKVYSWYSVRGLKGKDTASVPGWKRTCLSLDPSGSISYFRDRSFL